MLSDILLNSMPRYEAIIPSTKKSVSYRPFLVRDEKSLLTALETSESEKDMILTLSNLIVNCFTGIDNVSELHMSDLEYLLLQLRSKSIGEVVEFSIVGDNEETIEFSIDIGSDIEIVGEFGDKQIDLKENLSVTFRYPRVKDLLEEKKSTNETDNYIELISKCLLEIETPEEKINASLYSNQEKKDFIESMNKSQFQKVLDYFDKMPKMISRKKYIEGGKEKVIQFEGIKDFFV